MIPQPNLQAGDYSGNWTTLGKLIYVCVAALNVSAPVIDNSTLPSNSQKKYQSHEKT